MAVTVIHSRILGCWVLAAMLGAAGPVRADEPVLQSQQGGMLCTDGMVTDPDNDDLDRDDLEAIAVSAQVDGGCMLPDGPIGI
jgi:hypothetical protein